MTGKQSPLPVLSLLVISCLNLIQFETFFENSTGNEQSEYNVNGEWYKNFLVRSCLIRNLNWALSRATAIYKTISSYGIDLAILFFGDAILKQRIAYWNTQTLVVILLVVMLM